METPTPSPVQPETAETAEITEEQSEKVMLGFQKKITALKTPEECKEKGEEILTAAIAEGISPGHSKKLRQFISTHYLTLQA